MWWEIDLKLKDEPFSDNQEHDFFSGVKRSLADDSITVSNYLSDAVLESSKKKKKEGHNEFQWLETQVSEIRTEFKVYTLNHEVKSTFRADKQWTW